MFRMRFSSPTSARLPPRWRATTGSPIISIGIGRGGLVPAVYISHQLDLPMLSVDHSSKVPGFADELLGKVAEKSRDGTKLLVVDDINDSGGTIDYIRRLLAAVGCEAGNLRFAVLISNSRSKVSVDYWSRIIDRNEDKNWFVFPWEAMGTNDAINGGSTLGTRAAGLTSHIVTPDLIRGPAA